jgi:hypothetical protein
MTIKQMMQLAESGGDSAPWYLSGGAPLPIQANRFLNKASFSASKVNEITPGILNLSDGISIPTWAMETGALFNVAAGQYLRTGITFGIGGVHTALVCFTVNESGAGDATIFGAYGVNQFFVQRHKADGSLCFGADISTILAGQGLTTGTHTLAVSGNKAYLDGVDVTTTLTVVASDLEIYLGALNYADGAVQSCGCYITHWAFWDDELTAPQIVAVHDKAMAEAANP